MSINDGSFLLRGVNRLSHNEGKFPKRFLRTDMRSLRASSVKKSKEKKRRHKRSSSAKDAAVLKIIEREKEIERRREVAGMLRGVVKMYNDGEFGEAMKLGEKVLEKEEKSLEALYFCGRCALMLDDHQKVVECFKNLLKLNPKFKKQVYLFLSISLNKLEKGDEAVRMLDLAISNFPNFYEAYVTPNSLKIFRFIGEN
jgi:tetratricopeptide (TPR) repeat protein